MSTDNPDGQAALRASSLQASLTRWSAALQLVPHRRINCNCVDNVVEVGDREHLQEAVPHCSAAPSAHQVPWSSSRLSFAAAAPVIRVCRKRHDRRRKAMDSPVGEERERELTGSRLTLQPTRRMRTARIQYPTWQGTGKSEELAWSLPPQA